MNDECTAQARGAAALGEGGRSPMRWQRHARLLGSATFFVASVVASTGCNSKSDEKTYDPVSLGMLPGDTPLFDDQESQIFQSSRAVSLPILPPTQDDLARLGMAPVPPYDHTPWITSGDIKVQISWTVSNLEKDGQNVEILVDPWNEFGRYVPGVNVGEERTVPNLSGIDLLIRVDGMQRKSGTFTFDDMDELAIDLATVENIVAQNPPTAAMPGVPAASDNGPNVNGLVNHTFELHNRSSSDDKLIASYIPGTIAGLVGFDLGLRTFSPAKVAIEIVVEVTDVLGGRVDPDAPLKIDGTMWLSPEQEISAPAGAVR
jgi:hypothetical protein